LGGSSLAAVTSRRQRPGRWRAWQRRIPRSPPAVRGGFFVEGGSGGQGFGYDCPVGLPSVSATPLLRDEMSSLEQQIKDQYARIFRRGDWHLFKDVAEYHLRSAAYLRIKGIRYPRRQRLIRNIRKRLYIGVACELLLKAFYLKSGHIINKPARGKCIAASSPYRFAEVNLSDFDKYETQTMNYLIQELGKVHRFAKHNIVARGFTIAKVFRNKEGHVALPSHAYNPQNYEDIEQALIEFYREAFGEKLAIQISMERKERGKFKVKPLPVHNSGSHR
jgi:hypothetical protein